MSLDAENIQTYHSSLIFHFRVREGDSQSLCLSKTLAFTSFCEGKPEEEVRKQFRSSQSDVFFLKGATKVRFSIFCKTSIGVQANFTGALQAANLRYGCILPFDLLVFAIEICQNLRLQPRSWVERWSSRRWKWSFATNRVTSPVGTNMSPFLKRHFEDDEFPFPQVGYVSSPGRVVFFASLETVTPWPQRSEHFLRLEADGYLFGEVWIVFFLKWWWFTLEVLHLDLTYLVPVCLGPQWWLMLLLAVENLPLFHSGSTFASLQPMLLGQCPRVYNHLRKCRAWQCEKISWIFEALSSESPKLSILFHTISSGRSQGSAEQGLTCLRYSWRITSLFGTWWLSSQWFSLF